MGIVVKFATSALALGLDATINRDSRDGNLLPTRSKIVAWRCVAHKLPICLIIALALRWRGPKVHCKGSLSSVEVKARPCDGHPRSPGSRALPAKSLITIQIFNSGCVGKLSLGQNKNRLSGSCCLLHHTHHFRAIRGLKMPCMATKVR